jgi:hypothetical protein
MATDGSTFLLDPAEDEILAPQFQAWLDCQEEHYMNANRLTRMLSTNAHLKTNYEKLVPEEVCDFTVKYCKRVSKFYNFPDGSSTILAKVFIP